MERLEQDKVATLSARSVSLTIGVEFTEMRDACESTYL
ncbi:hypothetical protein JCM19231_2994 [Vibrio ishigakensis]|uniref:Uncharacterized protein n=1 Tax=Vibrio ishigakensis TaxID=1481914 RepID=A0A0B8NTM0_9VIBR|nr:hypothetical protein JCM19231_2994 [Vibrio ishigakensis]